MPALAAALSAVLLASVLVAIGLGPAVVAPGETVRYLWAAVAGGEIGADEVTRYQIVWQIRTPRVLLAAVVGAGLAAVGVVVQALVRNALADPFILGVSSGASVGAVAVSVSGGPRGWASTRCRRVRSSARSARRCWSISLPARRRGSCRCGWC